MEGQIGQREDGNGNKGRLCSEIARNGNGSRRDGTLAPSQFPSLWARKGHLSRRQEFDLKASLRKNYHLRCSKRAPKTRKGQCGKRIYEPRSQSRGKTLARDERRRDLSEILNKRELSRDGLRRRCERGRKEEERRNYGDLVLFLRLVRVKEEVREGRGHTHAKGKGGERQHSSRASA